MIRVIEKGYPPRCPHKLPGRRERKRLGLRIGAVVVCDDCGRAFKFGRHIDGWPEWEETTGSRILH